VSWDKRLIGLPDGTTLRTLEDARRHILTLPKSEHETTAWEVAIEALLIAAEKTALRRSFWFNRSPNWIKVKNRKQGSKSPSHDHGNRDV
jgi:hypothetical protein